MLIDSKAFLILRRKNFFLAIFSLYLLFLLLSSDVLADDWLEDVKKSAKQGDAQAQYILGLVYDYGRGVPENDHTAVQWYLKAAEQGHAEAQFNLGVMFNNGEGVTKDNVQAYAWISVAVAQGNSKFWKYVKETVSDSMTRDEIARAQYLSVDLWKAFGPTRNTN